MHTHTHQNNDIDVNQSLCIKQRRQGKLAMCKIVKYSTDALNAYIYDEPSTCILKTLAKYNFIHFSKVVQHLVSG